VWACFSSSFKSANPIFSIILIMGNIGFAFKIKIQHYLNQHHHHLLKLLFYFLFLLIFLELKL
jgi:multisubunit Na+/H+ antiporter MnhE subunit